MSQLETVSQFASHNGFDFIFNANALTRTAQSLSITDVNTRLPLDAWNSSQFEQLLSYAASAGIAVAAWELGLACQMIVR
jgi:hypothetical protein